LRQRSVRSKFRCSAIEIQMFYFPELSKTFCGLFLDDVSISLHDVEW
jgi:hypothetical protein